MKTMEKGFSLIELMIVIAIIGILAAIAIPSYQNYVLKAKLGEVISAASAAELAAAEYIQSSGASDCSYMPIVFSGLGPNGFGLFPYPTSNLVSSVEIDPGCNVLVTSATGQWGSSESTYGNPLMVGFATIDSQGGISFSCDIIGSTTLHGTALPYLPSSCSSS